MDQNTYRNYHVFLKESQRPPEWGADQIQVYFFNMVPCTLKVPRTPHKEINLFNYNKSCVVSMNIPPTLSNDTKMIDIVLRPCTPVPPDDFNARVDNPQFHIFKTES